MPIKPNLDYRLNKPFSTPILEIIDESSSVKTFKIKYNPIQESISYIPGQFVMVWVPGIDEIPMSISKYFDNGMISISVAKVGEATEKLFELKVGDIIGIRGPYGNGYSVRPGTAVIIGGGIGMASVLPLIYHVKNLVGNLNENEIKIDQVICIEGAKTEKDLIYLKELTDMFSDSSDFYVCTDDGSYGFQGFTTEKLVEILNQMSNQNQIDSNVSSITIYACGPEIMLKKIVEIGMQYDFDVQVSLERMMRCGFGICGLCALDPTGLLVCRDGPVFTANQLKYCSDFGKIHRDFSGKPYNI
ncbi:dihydroorotate dehydrogenase electron transfer subunit [Candidatus Harpocratesius sp.]